jgi:hypothetical protein
MGATGSVSHFINAISKYSLKYMHSELTSFRSPSALVANRWHYLCSLSWNSCQWRVRSFKQRKTHYIRPEIFLEQPSALLFSPPPIFLAWWRHSVYFTGVIQKLSNRIVSCCIWVWNLVSHCQERKEIVPENKLLNRSWYLVGRAA